MMLDLSFYKGRRVLVTGHTGFKGAWLSRVLVRSGAIVTGYALRSANPSMFTLVNISDGMHSVEGDVRNLHELRRCFEAAQPEVVFHLAAQPIVRESYDRPVYTYETNVMGTVNILECIRLSKTVRSFLNVTTDKVYLNREWEWGYRENEQLDGSDPYSNSKSCSELVTHSYKSSFFEDGRVAISTARAGNVIGGGDFAKDRIIPDCVRAALEKRTVTIRNANSVRPYQHVLEPIMVYLMIAEAQYQDKDFSGYYNVGPEEKDCLATGELVELFCEKWGEQMSFKLQSKGGPPESNVLKLDCSRLKSVFGWSPVWGIERAVESTVLWTKAMRDGRDLISVSDMQTDHFIKESKWIYK